MTDPAQHLDCYLVGGAVRDKLLGLPVKDRDWVVVGSSPEDMIELGFKPVGADFPVFLHPRSKEEYALARTERKTARGYHGFKFYSAPDVTLEQDLQRRDLTINAMAMDGAGQLVDPFGGQRDLRDRQIRHVSDAFGEDPVRILRVARFMARFDSQGFRLASETLGLMEKMVAAGEADALVAERVWQELRGSLGEPSPQMFIESLRQCGALAVVLPEIDSLFGVPQNPVYHPEIDTGVHTLMCLEAATQITDDKQVLFAVLVHDLGKALTPQAQWPAHRGHEKRGLKPIESLCQRLRVPGDYRWLALKLCEFHLHYHRAQELRPVTIAKLLEQLDGYRKPGNVEKFLQGCLADRRGRTGQQQADDANGQYLARCHRAALEVNGAEVAKQVTAGAASGENTGKLIKRELHRQRVAGIAQIKKA